MAADIVDSEGMWPPGKMCRRTQAFVEFGGRVEPIVCSSATPRGMQLLLQLLEVAFEIVSPDMLEHADADDAIVLPVMGPIVLETEFDPI